MWKQLKVIMTSCQCGHDAELKIQKKEVRKRMENKRDGHDEKVQ